jgi:hypothetical protein
LITIIGYENWVIIHSGDQDSEGNICIRLIIIKDFNGDLANITKNSNSRSSGIYDSI